MGEELNDIWGLSPLFHAWRRSFIQSVLRRLACTFSTVTSAEIFIWGPWSEARYKGSGDRSPLEAEQVTDIVDRFSLWNDEKFEKSTQITSGLLTSMFYVGS